MKYKIVFLFVVLILIINVGTARSNGSDWADFMKNYINLNLSNELEEKSIFSVFIPQIKIHMSHELSSSTNDLNSFYIRLNQTIWDKDKIDKIHYDNLYNNLSHINNINNALDELLNLCAKLISVSFTETYIQINEMEKQLIEHYLSTNESLYKIKVYQLDKSNTDLSKNRKSILDTIQNKYHIVPVIPIVTHEEDIFLEDEVNYLITNIEKHPYLLYNNLQYTMEAETDEKLLDLLDIYFNVEKDLINHNDSFYLTISLKQQNIFKIGNMSVSSKIEKNKFKTNMDIDLFNFFTITKPANESNDNVNKSNTKQDMVEYFYSRQETGEMYRQDLIYLNTLVESMGKEIKKLGNNCDDKYITAIIDDYINIYREYTNKLHMYNKILWEIRTINYFLTNISVL